MHIEEWEFLLFFYESMWHIIFHVICCWSSLSWREAFSQRLPWLWLSARTVYPPSAAELWHPCVSRQIWWIQVVGGPPQARLHYCDGRSPSLTLVQILRIWLAGTVCESLAMWPKWPSLCLQTMNETSTSSRPVQRRTSSLETKSCQLMCKIRRWHRIWKESSLFQSVCVRVQVSEPYSNTGRIHVEYMQIFVVMLTPDTIQSFHCAGCKFNMSNVFQSGVAVTRL